MHLRGLTNHLCALILSETLALHKSFLLFTYKENKCVHRIDCRIDLLSVMSLFIT